MGHPHPTLSLSEGEGPVLSPLSPAEGERVG